MMVIKDKTQSTGIGVSSDVWPVLAILMCVLINFTIVNQHCSILSYVRQANCCSKIIFTATALALSIYECYGVCDVAVQLLF